MIWLVFFILIKYFPIYKRCHGITSVCTSVFLHSMMPFSFFHSVIRPYLQRILHLGSISLKNFPSKFKVDGNLFLAFISLQIFSKRHHGTTVAPCAHAVAITETLKYLANLEYNLSISVPYAYFIQDVFPIFDFIDFWDVDCKTICADCKLHFWGTIDNIIGLYNAAC